MVLLHGAIECGGAMWTPAVRDLVSDYRLIVPDFPDSVSRLPLSRLDVDDFRTGFARCLTK